MLLAALALVIAVAIVVVLSLAGRPLSWFTFMQDETTIPGGDWSITGTAHLGSDSYLAGDVMEYSIRLYWRPDQVNPDLETFRGGVGFFPFNRRDVREQISENPDGVKTYQLDIELQAVDVEPSSSYTLSPPTVYYTDTDSGGGELKSYRINAPTVYIGAYYQPDVSGIALLAARGLIEDPLLLRRGIPVTAAAALLGFAAWLFWYFGRVRDSATLSEPERLWRVYHQLRSADPAEREYIAASEHIFTGLLKSAAGMSPAEFWAGQQPESGFWRTAVAEARELFGRLYPHEQPPAGTATGITALLDRLFAHLVEEERLRHEQQPAWTTRIIGQPAVLVAGGGIIAVALLFCLLALFPRSWGSADIYLYNEVNALPVDRDTIALTYERMGQLPDQLNNERIKAAALYNLAVLGANPELAGIDKYQQEAILKVMFQEQKVYMDALLHSLAMEDAFLLVAIIRDSLRNLVQSEASLKAAIRLNPRDEATARNLELVIKRRQAYAETIQELLTEGEDSGAAGEMQREALMDLEMLMQTEMPEVFTELEEGKNDKDYFILEGF